MPQVDPPVQPAGWAFSIWSEIYLWLIVSAGGVILMALIAATAVTRARPGAGYPIAVAWAALGLAAQNRGTQTGLTILALFGAAAMAALALDGLRRA